MKIDIYAFSSKGIMLSNKLIEGMKEHEVKVHTLEKYSKYAINVRIMDNLNESTRNSFANSDAIIFIGAAGIAVRAIAPFVENKAKDPAVICIDQRGINIIPLLSGHIGGANRLALKISTIIGGNPVITTATDINNLLSVDEWAVLNRMHIMDLKIAKEITSSILNFEEVGFYSDFTVKGSIPDSLNYSKKRGICVSLDENKKPFELTLNLVPEILSVGVGCRRGTSYPYIYNAIKEVFKKNNLSCNGIKSINSIDIKKDEEGIIKVAQLFQVPFNAYKKEELNILKGEFTKSSFVKKTTGVDSVCERAAVKGSRGGLIVKKTVINSITVAVAVDNYIVDFEKR